MSKQTVIAYNNIVLFADKILWKSLYRITGKKDAVL